MKISKTQNHLSEIRSVTSTMSPITNHESLFHDNTATLSFSSRQSTLSIMIHTSPATKESCVEVPRNTKNESGR